MKKLLVGLGAFAVLLFADTISGGAVFKMVTTMTELPASDEMKLFFKTDKKLYKVDSSGTETEIGAGGGSGWDTTDWTKFQIMEEFNNGTTASNSVGTHGWSSATYGSGGLDVNGTPVADLFGYASGSAHSTNADSGGLFQILYSDSSNIVNYDWTWEARVKLASTSNSRTWIGIGASAAVVPARFVGFRYDTSSSYTDDTKSTTGRWVAQMCVSSGCTDAGGARVITTVQPNTSFHRYKMVKVSGTYTFSIDGTQVATFCASGCDTTVTTMNGSSYMGFLTLCFETGASFTQSYVDRFYLNVTGLSR